MATSESNPPSKTCLTHARTTMATVAAASDARPRRYAKEQPTAAPFPPPQADFSLAGRAVIQGVVDGLAFGALVPMVVSWHTATLRPSCGSARTTAVPDNYGRHPEPSGHMCGIEQARAAAPASPAATGGCLLHHCCCSDSQPDCRRWLLLVAATSDLYAQPSQQAHGRHQPGV